jgi:hypothetical protein
MPCRLRGDLLELCRPVGSTRAPSKFDRSAVEGDSLDSCHTPGIRVLSNRMKLTMNSARHCMFILLALPRLAHGGARAQDSTSVDAARLALASSLVAATVVGVHIYQQNAWWQGPRAPFRFENDWEYALNIDKFGHAYGAYLLSNVFTYTMSWVGFRDATSVFWGAVLGLSYQLYVEVEDGFHREYGFSPGDAFADVAGAMIPLAQATFPVLKNFDLKWSYSPSQEYLDALKQNKGRVFIDDYQGQIYWLTVDPHFLMAEGLSKAVPSWLGLALGAAVRNLDGAGNGEKIFYVSLDYNLSKIETSNSLLRAVFTALDFIHLPAPGIALEGNQVKVGVFY